MLLPLVSLISLLVNIFYPRSSPSLLLPSSPPLPTLPLLISSSPPPHLLFFPFDLRKYTAEEQKEFVEIAKRDGFVVLRNHFPIATIQKVSIGRRDKGEGRREEGGERREERREGRRDNIGKQ